MANVQLLSSIIKQKGKTNDAVASAIGMNRSTFYRKIKKNGEPFTVEEVRRLANFIPLSKAELRDIFLL